MSFSFLKYFCYEQTINPQNKETPKRVKGRALIVSGVRGNRNPRVFRVMSKTCFG